MIEVFTVVAADRFAAMEKVIAAARNCRWPHGVMTPSLETALAELDDIKVNDKRHG